MGGLVIFILLLYELFYAQQLEKAIFIKILEGSFMKSLIQIRQMNSEDVEFVFQGLVENNIGKPFDYIKRCWDENETGERSTLIAIYDQKFAGWLHLLSKSIYPYFVEQGIPEINNFDVVPSRRRLGISNALMDAIEEIAFDKHGIVGIGVGLYNDYGNAQRLYAKRGYTPDGRGIISEGNQVEPGSSVFVGDDLALWLIKKGMEIPEKLS
ncbi:GNAT family N-acetyltransferase [Paenibacillus frigoriresistens]|uniref:GNAT family N-acetyltransferase n=1 Tax=Paenibacillus alginolyticus TaxID=59839 RepID=UPI00156603E0|nr:GNAT family N-acetyltransferase [Paenibacillus frigoriresistens]NRF95994.1 GNAT family N-acetyltransferase [Paenibacillus frigoriresistens]